MFSRLIALALVLVSWTAVAHSQDATPIFATAAKQAILIDAKSGSVFFEKDADTAVPPASMSKLMTQAIVFDMLKKGDLKRDQEFLITEDAWKRGGNGSGSTMFANVNSRVSIDSLLHGAIIQSANDACIALAEGIAGSEEAFAQRMMLKAKEIGLANSNFANATGLPDPGQRMSVRDLAKLARYIIQNHPDEFKIYGQPEFTWNKITQQNRNPLLKDYPGADGMKTGYTKEAGYGLVGTAIRDGRRLIMVVAGLDTLNARKTEAQKLMDFGFSQFRTVGVYEAGDVVTRARVWGGGERWVNLIAPETFKIALAPFEQDRAEVKMTYSGPLLAPVKAGTSAGTVRILVDGKPVAEAPLQTANDVAATDSMWRKASDSALIMLFGG